MKWTWTNKYVRLWIKGLIEWIKIVLKKWTEFLKKISKISLKNDKLTKECIFFVTFCDFLQFTNIRNIKIWLLTVDD